MNIAYVITCFETLLSRKNLRGLFGRKVQKLKTTKDGMSHFVVFLFSYTILKKAQHLYFCALFS